MKYFIAILCIVSFLLTGCSNDPSYPPAPNISLTSTEGETFQLDAAADDLLVLFISLDNPQALNQVKQMEKQFAENIDIVAIPRSHDRQFMITALQQQTLIPVVMDSNSAISTAFGNVTETPAMFFIRQGKIVLQQFVQFNLDNVNNVMHSNL